MTLAGIRIFSRDFGSTIHSRISVASTFGPKNKAFLAVLDLSRFEVLGNEFSELGA